jgi:hypothetical protein
MRLHPGLLLIPLFTATICPAQQPSPWQGEWGHFGDVFPGSGARLTVTNCTGASCKFFLTVAQSTMSACSSPEDTSTLTVLSSTEATATMPGEDNKKSCTLHLHRTSTPPNITVTSSGNDCAYYCTSNVTFNSTLPLRSSAIFNTQHLDACFSKASPAILATCNDPTLGALEQTWSSLYADFPLQSHPAAENGDTYAQTVDAAILKQCDTAPSPADCLRTRFSADIATMNANKAAFVAGYTDRGDPALAPQVAARIAGRYRHSIANGDVQGDHFRSTDTLTLTPISRNSIHFDVHLEFYNGHTCDLSGGALFRKDGSFVFDDDPTNAAPNDPVCHLAIVPTANGVQLRDLTGFGCKNISCGERGGYNDAGFTFSDRVTSKDNRISPDITTPTKKPHTP